MKGMTIPTLVLLAAVLSACSNGGNLTLEPGAIINKRKASTVNQVNQGGKALVIEQGKTATTGVHGWVTVNNVVGKTLTDGNRKIIMNKTTAENP